MIRYWLAAAAGACLFASVLLAEPGVVVTRSGQRFEGDIKEQPQSVTITVKGIQTTVDRADITSLVYSADVEQLFHKRLAALAAEDVDGRIALAHWAVEQDRYDLALQVLNQVTKIDPNNRQAYEFIRVIDHQRDLQPATAQAQPASGPATTRAGAPRAAAPSGPLVSRGDINTIRQLELKPSDAGVRVRIENEVRRQYVNRSGITFRAFDDLSPAQQATTVIYGDDPQWRGGVQILNDPPAMAQYKRLIQPVILAGCAASGCHGNADRGGFELYTPANRDAVSYTNFYILTQYAKTLHTAAATQGAFVGAARLTMLNRTNPDESLLAQYGLPRGMATYSHPDVSGFRPIYRNRQAPHYQELVQWLGQSLVNIQPDYGITDVRLPSTQPSTQPTQPATGTTKSF